MVATASTAPAAPSRCPIADLVEDTGMSLAASPSAALMASVSARSLRGVEVPCALTYTMSSVLSSASARATRIASAAPAPSLSGAVRW